VTNREQAPTVGRCKATNKRGDPCAATVVGADGLCSAHSGRQDMRELGHRGGKARRKGLGEQLAGGERESLRQHLRANLDHSTIVEAVQRSLAGANESARVAAVKFLADLELYRKDGDECPRCAAVKAEGPAAWERVNELIARLVESAVRQEFGVVNEESDSEAMKLVRGAVRRGLKGHEQRLADVVEGAVDRLIESMANGLVVSDVATPEDAGRVIDDLVEMGVLDWKVEELAEARAQDRLAALKQEHGLVGV
jgi:hypothetical protein